MKAKISLVLIALAAFALASCTSAASVKNIDAHPEFYTDNPPVSILVMPPINQTNYVDAKDYFYYTLEAALANKGYYVFPPLLSMNTLQENSAYDSELFLEGNIAAFRRTFGADLLLFTKITEWEKHPVGGHVDVTVEYILRSTATGETIYQRKGTFDADTTVSVNGGGILGLLIQVAATAAKTAATDYTTVARACNYSTLDMPAGKYSPLHLVDAENAAGANPTSAKWDVSGFTDEIKFTPEQVSAAETARAERMGTTGESSASE